MAIGSRYFVAVLILSVTLILAVGSGGSLSGQLVTDTSQLCFTGLVSADLPSQTLNIEGTVGTWTATTDAPWLTVTPPQGQGPASVQVSADSAGLPDGAYQGVISIADASGQPALTVRVGLSLYSPGQTPGWQLQTVEPGSSAADESLSLALDPQDRPGITAMRNDATFPQQLRYHFWTGCGWQVENIASYAINSSLAFDSAGQPHISFVIANTPTYILKYASRGPQGWNVVTVDDQGPDGNTGQWDSLVLDATGQPHISYLLKFSGGSIFTYDLRYGAFDGAAWTLETVATHQESGWYTSLALGATGQPRISYYVDPDATLGYAEVVGEQWKIQTVDRAGVTSSLRLDSSGRPRVAYQGMGADVRFAYRDDTQWQIETIGQQGQSPDGSGRAAVCMALDAMDVPHVVYGDFTTGRLKYATRVGPGNWTIDVIDQSANFGNFCALRFDHQGVPHVAYIDMAQQTLKYAQGPAVQ
jgi:hypothetical protein